MQYGLMVAICTWTIVRRGKNEPQRETQPTTNNAQITPKKKVETTNAQTKRDTRHPNTNHMEKTHQ